jgi:uncharacterized protein YbjT (DUF2867 family)
MTARSIALFGATGLVGRECLRLLLERAEFARVLVCVRRQVALDVPTAHRAKLDLQVIDFDRLDEHAGLFAVDQILCALGTTIRKAGSQPAFRTVDFTYPEKIARLGIERGARHFLLVSALGASAGSGVFYNRVKGELEDAVLAMPYRSHTLIRPSLLLGERAEFRFGERVAARFAFLAPRKYKPVHAADVARSLVNAALAELAGVQVIESTRIEWAAAPHSA